MFRVQAYPTCPTSWKSQYVPGPTVRVIFTNSTIPTEPVLNNHNALRGQISKIHGSIAKVPGAVLWVVPHVQLILLMWRLSMFLSCFGLLHIMAHNMQGTQRGHYFDNSP